MIELLAEAPADYTWPAIGGGGTVAVTLIGIVIGVCRYFGDHIKRGMDSRIAARNASTEAISKLPELIEDLIESSKTRDAEQLRRDEQIVGLLSKFGFILDNISNKMLSKNRLVLIEDNQDDAYLFHSLLADKLHKHGLLFDWAPTLEDASKKWDGARLVVADLHIRGWDVPHVLKTLGRNGVPVVAYSGDEDAINDAVKQGWMGVVKDPKCENIGSAIDAIMSGEG